MKKLLKMIAGLMLSCVVLFGAVSCKPDVDSDADIGLDQLSSTTYKNYDVTIAYSSTNSSDVRNGRVYAGRAEGVVERKDGVVEKNLSFRNAQYKYGTTEKESICVSGDYSQNEAPDVVINLPRVRSETRYVSWSKIKRYEIYGNVYTATNSDGAVMSVTKDNAFDFDTNEVQEIIVTDVNGNTTVTYKITVTPKN